MVLKPASRHVRTNGSVRSSRVIRGYRLKRSSRKKTWYSKYPGDCYQSSYRANHPDYASVNREKQRFRASKVTKMANDEKIVKTDALFTESPVNEVFYALIPFQKTCTVTRPENIVKTDALIVKLLNSQGLQAILSARSP